MIVLLLANVATAIQFGGFYSLLLMLQILFYALGIAGWLMRKRASLPTFVYVPFYFCTMNTAACSGCSGFLRRTQQVQWRKAQRSRKMREAA
ncbi:MAG: hypothetical protein IPP88_20685 [Betaproteobacteria bacterium]|nr:hypothetical protein [Betaproteobacteria bacterium]